MFGKILLTVAVIAIVWFGFKYLARVAELKHRAAAPEPMKRPDRAPGIESREHGGMPRLRHLAAGPFHQILRPIRLPLLIYAEVLMPKAKKPTPPKKLSETEKLIQECVKKAQARKKSGQTDREWRAQYASSLKVDGDTVPLSETPFDGDARKRPSRSGGD